MPEKQSSIDSKSSNANPVPGKPGKATSVATKDPPQSKESSVAKEVTPVADDAQSQMQALIDRRIRNLEKRKVIGFFFFLLLLLFLHTYV